MTLRPQLSGRSKELRPKRRLAFSGIASFGDVESTHAGRQRSTARNVEERRGTPIANKPAVLQI